MFPRKQNYSPREEKSSVFLCGIGFTIIAPVVPFLVRPYINNPGDQAIVVTLLTSVYAVCVFFAAPGLGALSDRYGRRPVLLVCLLGSAAGYLVFGIGDALWVLFAGRIIDGVTGGAIGTIFAYFADITPREQRTKYFGWISAIAGAGAVIGPTLGGLLARFGYSVPLYFGAIITLLNVIYGILYMPDSLDRNDKLKKIALVRLNPFTQLANVLSMKNLKKLLAASALFSFYPVLIAGMFLFGFGDSIFGPSFNGMVSKTADSGEQGRVQGGSQAVQSLARIIGPVIGGQIYVLLGHASPAFMGMILIAAAMPVMRSAGRGAEAPAEQRKSESSR